MKIALNTIIAELISSKDTSSHEFVRHRNLGVKGCRHFNMNVSGRLKTVLLDVNANKTVTIPEDCLTFSKIGVVNDQGEIVTLTRNNQLSGYHALYTAIPDRYEGLPTLNTGIGTSPTVFPFVYYNYWLNGTSYNLFGMASGTGVIGTFQLDEEAGVILLDPDIAYTQLVMEYISSGFDDSVGDFMIDVKCEEAFICWLRWQSAIDQRKKFSDSSIRLLRKEFYREEGLAKRRMNPVIISEMQAVQRTLTKLTARA